MTRLGQQGWLEGQGRKRAEWSSGVARPIVTPPVTAVKPPPPKPLRGVCGRCGQATADHREGGMNGACSKYSPAVSCPPPLVPPGLVAIVDTREPDHANERESHLHRRPWVWNADLYDEDCARRFRADVENRPRPKPFDEEGWERIPCLRAALPAGDYSALGCVDRILIEWKEPGDLASTLYGMHEENYARFLREVATAFELFPGVRFVIMVPCSVADILAHCYEADVDPKSVIGRCNRLLLDFGVATIFAGDHGEAERQVGSLLKSAWEDEAAVRKGAM